MNIIDVSKCILCLGLACVTVVKQLEYSMIYESFYPDIVFQ